MVVVFSDASHPTENLCRDLCNRRESRAAEGSGCNWRGRWVCFKELCKLPLALLCGAITSCAILLLNLLLACIYSCCALCSCKLWCEVGERVREALDYALCLALLPLYVTCQVAKFSMGLFLRPSLALRPSV